MKTVEPFTPVQYIMGKTKFCGLDFLVDARVLIPRPETELVVESVIEGSRGIPRLRSGREGQGARILDLGTGSGCIAISLTKRISDCRIVASDISEAALEVAKINAIRHGVSDRIEFVKSDLFDKLEGRFDIIVSNPPYIARFEFETLQKEVLKEPRIALDGGGDGLDFYRKISSAACGFLKPYGYLVMEIGYGQRKEICGIIEKSGSLNILEIKKDHNGIDRVIVAQWIN